MTLITHFHQMLRLRMSGPTPLPPLLPPYAFKAWPGAAVLLPLLCYILLYKNLNPHCSVSKASGFEMDSHASVFFRASFSFHHPIANDPGDVWSPVQ